MLFKFTISALNAVFDLATLQQSMSFKTSICASHTHTHKFKRKKKKGGNMHEMKAKTSV